MKTIDFFHALPGLRFTASRIGVTQRKPWTPDGNAACRRVRHLPVLDAEGEVVGLVSIGDLNAYLTTHHEVTIHYMHEYLHGRV